MMMLNLNFLPENFRKGLKLTAWIAWFKNIMRSALIVLLAFNVFLLLIYVVLSEQASLLVKRSEELSQSYSFYNQEVEGINEKINTVNQAGSNFGLLTPRFWTIISTVPGNIQLKNLGLSLEQSNRLTLSGVAESREALLEYEQTLKKINWVEDTLLPTSQLLQKENINFSIELKTKTPSPEEYLGTTE